MRLSWAWLLMLLLMPGWAWSGAAPTFDLTAWDFGQNGGFDLNGTWELYWDELRMPGQVSTLPPEHVSLPMSWVFHQPELPRFGVASYRAIVRLPSSHEQFGLKLDWIFSAYRVYWNGRLITEVGKVGMTPESYQAQISRQLLLLPQDTSIQNNELIIQISNFTYHKPGIAIAPQIDYYDTLQIQRERVLTLQMFVAGAIFLMGIYHLGVFFLRRQEYSALFFSLVCFVVATYNWISGEGFSSFSEYVPNNVWWFLFFLCWFLGAALFLMFTMAVFPKFEIRKISLSFLVISYAAIIAIIVLPTRLYFDYAIVIQIAHVFLGLYLIYVGTRAVIEKLDGSLFFALATMVMLVCMINDMLLAEQKIISIYLTGHGLLIFISLQSFILAQRHAHSFQTVAQYSNELEHLKSNLEKQVEARTSALHIALKETRKMNERLITISRTDVLTGAYNRRYFVERLDEEWRRAMREKNRLVMLLIDIDHFKQFNDRHGHLCGDYCLRHVAALIKQHFQRAADFVARYGGEEFVVLAYGDTSENLSKVAEKLTVTLSEKPFEFDGTKLYVTLSMGIGELVPTPEYNQDDLIRTADSALYKAKATGRDRIVRADVPIVREL